jgi:hypothetical protein
LADFSQWEIHVWTGESTGNLCLLGFCSGKSKKSGYQEDIKGISYDMWQCLKIKDLPITLPFIEKMMMEHEILRYYTLF